MKKKIRLTIILILAIICTFGLNFNFADASSAKISVSGGGNVTVGSNVTVKVTYSGVPVGTIRTDVSYDSSKLKYQSAKVDGQANGGNGAVVVSMIGNGSTSVSFTLTFKTLATGSATVKVVTTEFYNNDDLSDCTDCGGGSVKYTIKDNSPTVSSNADLEYLRASAGSLSPAFSPNTTSYKVYTTKDTKQCTLSFDVANEKATYKIQGSSELSSDEHVRKIIVTAENGNTKTYTVTIIRSGSSSNKGTTPKEEDPVKPTDESIEVKLGDKTYTIVEDFTEDRMPKGYTIQSAKYDDKEIPVIKDIELKYAFALLKDKETGNESWMFYDEESCTFSNSINMTVEDFMKYQEELDLINQADPGFALDNNQKLLIMVAACTLGVLVIVVIVLQIVIINRNKSRKAKRITNRESYEPIDEENVYSDSTLEDEE